MRLRQLVLACGLASLLASPLVNALGLGEVRLNSTLNQPLSAEISLLDTRDLTAEQIIVSLASPADFERNGVDRLYFYTEFKFEVDLENPAGPVVKVTSRNPVREPYLNFLVEARWTAGRLLREYTLLMDLPTYDDNRSVSPVVAPRQVETPKEARTTQGRVSRQPDVQPEFTREAETTERSVSRVAQDGEYTIKPNDTLWEIALDVRPDNTVSVHQAMVALYEANPDAFINGNISRLKEGKVLRVPDAGQMTSLSKSESASQFSQLESGMGAQLSASRRTSSEASESSDISGRVTLAAANNPRSSSGQGSGADNGSGRALETELASTLEELDRVKSENTELTSRVQDLESQIQTMEKMVSVGNEKLRALQVSAEKTNQEKSQLAEELKSELKTEETLTTSSAVSSAAPQKKSEPAPKKQPEQVKPKPVPKPAPAPTIVDQLIANAPWIGVGVAVLGGLIGFLVYRRRKQAQLEQEQLEQDMSYSNDSDLSFDTSMDDHETFAEQEAEHDQESFDGLDAEDDDVNPADKADIFIAYGQLDKAEHLLLKGLAKDPNSSSILMKLLEVYSQQKDATSFDKHYAALIPVAAPALLSRASELRSHIPNAGDFDMPDLAPDLSDEPAVKAQQAASLDDLELDLGDDIFAEEAKPVVDQDDDFSIELDLTEDFDAQDTVMRGQQAESAEIELDLDDDLALDLDFDTPDIDLSADIGNVESQADDIGDINLALDEMEDDDLDEDVYVASIEKEPSLSPIKSVKQDLELADDDFNLDVESEGVDLAALDSEMSSLDTDFDLDDDLSELAEDSADIDFALEDDLSLDDSELSLDEDEEFSLGEELDEVTETADSNLDELELSLDDELELESSEDDMEVLEDEPEVVTEESLFEEALSDIDDQDVALTELDNADHEQNLDSDDLDFLGEADEAATKLDLARAYIDMGDMTGARDILSEVVNEGTSDQKAEAKDLLSRIDA
jgi:pilus assembly protein FimV